MLRIPPRLVHLAPAGVGLADPGLLQRTRASPADAQSVPRRRQASRRERQRRVVQSDPSQLLGPDFAIRPASSRKLRKEKDIFDVWFESGQLMARGAAEPAVPEFPGRSLSGRLRPASRLVPAFAVAEPRAPTGQPPFKQVLTHGFVVKPDGTKVSKSDKEYVKAVDEINRHGADLLRLWCCSVDYQNDIPSQPQGHPGIRRQIPQNPQHAPVSAVESIRLQPADRLRSLAPADSLDGWALDQLDTLIVEVKSRVRQLSTAPRLPPAARFLRRADQRRLWQRDEGPALLRSPASPLRRRCQTVMHRMVLALTKLLAPMLVFTADEAWEQIAHKPTADADLVQRSSGPAARAIRAERVRKSSETSGIC